MWLNDRPGLGVSVDEKALTFVEEMTRRVPRGDPSASRRVAHALVIASLDAAELKVAVDVAGLAVKRDPPAYTYSEREAKRELYQSRLVRLCGDTTQIGLRRRGDLRVGHSELGSIEQVERLGAERQIHAAVDWRRFGHGEVPVVHVVSPQIGVNSRRVAQLPSRLWIRGHCGIRHAEARGVEPSVEPI